MNLVAKPKTSSSVKAFVWNFSLKMFAASKFRDRVTGAAGLAGDYSLEPADRPAVGEGLSGAEDMTCAVRVEVHSRGLVSHTVSMRASTRRTSVSSSSVRASSGAGRRKR